MSERSPRPARNDVGTRSAAPQFPVGSFIIAGSRRKSQQVSVHPAHFLPTKQDKFSSSSTIAYNFPRRRRALLRKVEDFTMCPGKTGEILFVLQKNNKKQVLRTGQEPPENGSDFPAGGDFFLSGAFSGNPARLRPPLFYEPRQNQKKPERIFPFHGAAFLL